MNASRGRATFLALLLAWAGTAGAEGNIKLFDFPGANRTGFTGINDRGKAVGVALTIPTSQPFLYDFRTGALDVLTSPPGDVNMMLNGINNRGAIVGVLLNPDGLTGPGFIRNADATFTFFTHPDCDGATDARAINEDGFVVGSCNRGDQTVGFLYNAAKNRFRNITVAPYVFMHGVNVHAISVGQAMFPADQDPCGGGPAGAALLEYGLVRYPDGTITLFQVNRQQTDAGDITDDGVVVGSAFDPAANTDRLYATRIKRKPCFFARVPRSEFLSPPGTEVVVNGVNDYGRVVGIAFVSQDGPHGFYRTIPPR